MEEKKGLTYQQAGDTYKAMLLQAHPLSPLYKLASYQICKCVLKHEELYEYEKLERRKCSCYKVTVLSGITSFISFMIAGFIGNIYVVIVPVLTGAVYVVAAIKQNRAEKEMKLIEKTARAKYEKE